MFEFFNFPCRIYITRKPDMAAHHALRFRPEDGHAAAWRRCNRGEESREDPQVSAEHGFHNRSVLVRHAGRGSKLDPCLFELNRMSFRG